MRSSERSARLPVWPAWNGLAFVVLDLLGQNNLATHLEDLLGGRVSPMMLDAREADPFILLVHHRHSFQKFDPLRAAFRFLMAEGFPAHPHRGLKPLPTYYRASAALSTVTPRVQDAVLGRGRTVDDRRAGDSP